MKQCVKTGIEKLKGLGYSVEIADNTVIECYRRDEDLSCFLDINFKEKAYSKRHLIEDVYPSNITLEEHAIISEILGLNKTVKINSKTYLIDKLEMILDDESTVLESVGLCRCSVCGEIFNEEDVNDIDFEHDEKLCCDCLHDYIGEQLEAEIGQQAIESDYWNDRI